MEIVISEAALKWFKSGMGLMKGDHLRFYAQFYGSSPVQKGYTLGFAKDEPINSVASTERDGILFFVEENDLWYFDGHDLHVEYYEKEDDLEFKYIKRS